MRQLVAPTYRTPLHAVAATALLLTLPAIGLDGHRLVSAADPAPAVMAPQESLTFGGTAWKLAGPVEQHQRTEMRGFQYLGEAHGVRLLELLKTNPNERGVYRRILQVQRLVDGAWVDDGPMETWLRDGSRDTGHRRLGKLEGSQRSYDANGKLKVERIYSDNERRCASTGWYPSGTKQYESLQVDGVELSGRTWSESGVLVER